MHHTSASLGARSRERGDVAGSEGGAACAAVRNGLWRSPQTPRRLPARATRSRAAGAKAFTHLLLPMCHLGGLKDDDAPAAVTGGQIIPRPIELYRANQILCAHANQHGPSGNGAQLSAQQQVKVAPVPPDASAGAARCTRTIRGLLCRVPLAEDLPEGPIGMSHEQLRPDLLPEAPRKRRQPPQNELRTAAAHGMCPNCAGDGPGRRRTHPQDRQNGPPAQAATLKAVALGCSLGRQPSRLTQKCRL